MLLNGQHMVEKLVRRLQTLDEAHQAFILTEELRVTSRLLYLLRSSPAYRHPALLSRVDEAVHRDVETVTNEQLQGISRRQATLPVTLGGLGVRMVTDVALPAYLASQVASADTIVTTSKTPFGR